MTLLNNEFTDLTLYTDSDVRSTLNATLTEVVDSLSWDFKVYDVTSTDDQTYGFVIEKVLNNTITTGNEFIAIQFPVDLFGTLLYRLTFTYDDGHDLIISGNYFVSGKSYKVINDELHQGNVTNVKVEFLHIDNGGLDTFTIGSPRISLHGETGDIPTIKSISRQFSKTVYEDLIEQQPKPNIEVVDLTTVVPITRIESRNRYKTLRGKKGYYVNKQLVQSRNFMKKVRKNRDTVLSLKSYHDEKLPVKLLLFLDGKYTHHDRLEIIFDKGGFYIIIPDDIYSSATTVELFMCTGMRLLDIPCVIPNDNFNYLNIQTTIRETTAGDNIVLDQSESNGICVGFKDLDRFITTDVINGYVKLPEYRYPVDVNNSIYVFDDNHRLVNTPIEYVDYNIVRLPEYAKPTVSLSIFYRELDGEYDSYAIQYSKYFDLYTKVCNGEVPAFITNGHQIDLSKLEDIYSEKELSNDSEVYQYFIDLLKLKPKLYDLYIKEVIEKNRFEFDISDAINSDNPNNNSDIISPTNLIETEAFTNPHKGFTVFNPKNYNVSVYVDGYRLSSDKYRLYEDGKFTHIYILDDGSLVDNCIVVELMTSLNNDFVSPTLPLDPNEDTKFTYPTLSNNVKDLVLLNNLGDGRYEDITNLATINKTSTTVTVESGLDYDSVILKEDIKYEYIEKLDYPVGEVYNEKFTNINSDKIRAYVNGRRIHDITNKKINSINILENDIYYVLNNDGLENDVIFEKLSYKPNVIYDDVFPTDGILTLSNNIYPLTLDYYDMYVNGRKLCSIHVESISDNTIAISGVQSTERLVIESRIDMYNIFNKSYFDSDNLWSTFIGNMTTQQLLDLGIVLGDISNVEMIQPEYTHRLVLHYLLYKLYLSKDGQIDANEELPGYIIDVFNGLQEEDGTILIDANEEQILMQVLGVEQ